MKPGASVIIRNGKIDMFKGSMRLAVDRWGHIDVTDLSLVEYELVNVACCVSISGLLTRLSGFPNMKKDGTSNAAKLIQPILKLIQEDSSDAEGAVLLLSTNLNLFPSSLQKNYDSVKATIITKLM